MSIFKPNTKEQYFVKYDFPRVVISGTQICCGLRPCYLDNAKFHYYDRAGVAAPYATVQQIIFGMCFFTKHLKLHQYHKRAPAPGLETSGDAWRYVDIMYKPNGEFTSMYPGGGPVNFRYWMLDLSKSILFTHYTATMDTLSRYIRENDIGLVTETATWINPNTRAGLKTLIWTWNGRVPTPESCGFIDFPFDMEGNLIPGRTNFIDRHGRPVFVPEAAPATAAQAETPPATPAPQVAAA